MKKDKEFKYRQYEKLRTKLSNMYLKYGVDVLFCIADTLTGITGDDSLDIIKESLKTSKEMV